MLPVAPDRGRLRVPLYWSGLPVEAAELYRDPIVLLLGPTNDNQTLVISYWPIADFPEVGPISNATQRRR